MNSGQLDKSRKSGEKVWATIQSQVAEGGGFITAMFQSFKNFVKKILKMGEGG